MAETSPPSLQPPFAVPPPVKKKGCFYYGCLTAIVLTVITAIVAALGVYVSVRFLKGKINEYTDTKPIVLPVVELSPQQLSQVQQKLAAFADAVREGRSAAALVLSAEEINGLVNSSPDWKELKGKVFVEIKDSQVRGQISLPLEKLSLKGRYLNGKAMLSVTTGQNGLNISILELEVNGRTPEDVFMQRLRNTNLAEEFSKEPKNREILEKLGGITVENGLISIFGPGDSAVTHGEAL